jgi:hypothetical protein
MNKFAQAQIFSISTASVPPKISKTIYSLMLLSNLTFPGKGTSTLVSCLCAALNPLIDLT